MSWICIESCEGSVLDVTMGPDSFEELITQDFNGGDTQLWRWNEDGTIENKWFGFSWRYGEHTWTRQGNYIQTNLNDEVLTMGHNVFLHPCTRSIRQRWFFRPEEQLFLIIQRSTSLALGLPSGLQGEGVKVSSINNPVDEFQMWTMGKLGNLDCQVGLTAEVYGATKEVDVCVVGTVSHGGESQQWTLEDGRLKTNLSDDTSGDLVMEIVENDKVKIRLRNEENADQLFHLVPVDLMNDFIFMHENRNALTEANFLKKIYDDYFWITCGFVSIFDFKKAHNEIFIVLEDCAALMDKISEDTGIAATVGGSASIIGGVLGVAGLLGAPFTAGLSLSLSVVGAGVAVVGGVTSLIGNVISSIWEQVEEAKFKCLLTELRVSILRLQSFHNKYTHKLQEAYTFIQTEEGVRFALSVKDVDEVGMKPPGVKNHFWENACNVISATLNSHEVVRVLKEIKDLVKFLKPDYYMNSSHSGLAVIVNHPRFQAHGVDSVGNLITESVKTVSAIAIIFNDILGIVFGIWDVVSGANKIRNGSQMASDLRETVKKLKALVEDQVNLDEALQQ